MPRNFGVTISDLDGEEHIYTFIASNVWTIAEHIIREMDMRRDFYGQHRFETSTLTIAELIPEANMSDAIELA